MDKQEFMNAVNKAVVEGSIDGLKQILLTPPGRAPHRDLVEESNWYNNLNETDREMADRIIKRSVESGIFHFLCILDGVSTIESGTDKGVLKLIYEKGDETVLLNDEQTEYLHDMMD